HVIPTLAYENGVAALEWLAAAFGFREVARQIAKDGTLSHGEMECGGGRIMLATPTPDYESPRHHPVVRVRARAEVVAGAVGDRRRARRGRRRSRALRAREGRRRGDPLGDRGRLPRAPLPRRGPRGHA